MGFPGSILITDGAAREQHSSQRHPLGTRAYTKDGRVFRYANAGAAITRGRLCQARAPGSWSDDMVFAAANYAIGTTQVTVLVACGSTAAKSSDGTENYFKEGYLFINDGTGEGQYVPIKRQGLWTTASTAGHYSTVEFQDGAFLPVAVTSASECGFVLNAYKRVVMQPKAITSIPVGIAPRTVTSGYYFWLQTWGPAAYWAGGTLQAGKSAIVDFGTNTGYIRIITTETWKGTGTTAGGMSSDLKLTGLFMPRIGTIMEVGANNEVGMVYLTIAS